MNVRPLALAKLYRGMLDEALAEARATGAVDREAEAKIRDAFSASIPSTVPSHLSDKAASPTLPSELRADAARLLVRISLSLPPPRGAFVAAVAKAAADRRDIEPARQAPSRMANRTIQLLIFRGCPLAPAARASLKEALAELGILTYQEINMLDPATPEDLRRWASPTILVDGVDVRGAGPADNVACRALDSIPSAATIIASIRGRA